MLKDQTVAEAENFAGQLKVGNIDQLLNSLQTGVSFPGREDIISILNTVKDKAAQQNGGPQDGADQQQGDQSGGSDQEGDGQQDDESQGDGEPAGGGESQ